LEPGVAEARRGLPRRADLWLPGYLRSRLARLGQRRGSGPIDILFSICDHYEPDHGGVPISRERERVNAWVRRYPETLDRFRDFDGRPPQHTFFFPAEMYRAEHLDQLAGLCARGYAEVEVHLHHGHDSAAGLTDTLERFKETLAVRHGLLSEDRAGRVRYAFIHGNWALDNGRLDDRYCGVDNEISVLRATGCYADLTMPAAPDAAQSRIVNSVYYTVDDPLRPRSYDRGVHARVGALPPADALLMIQGPLSIYRKHGVVPALENGALDASPGHHPTLSRFRRWVQAGISVAGRPEWVIIKVYSHGAKESNANVLLGSPSAAFHEAIGREYNDGRRYRLHYVTAREIANIVRAAEDGLSGNPNEYRDYALVSRVARPARAAAVRQSEAEAHVSQVRR
jgi:hypothetical protein